MQWFQVVFNVDTSRCITRWGGAVIWAGLIQAIVLFTFALSLSTQGGKLRQTSDWNCADKLFSLEPTALHSVFPPVYKRHGTLHSGRTLPINLCLSSAEPRADTAHMLQHFQSQSYFYITFHLYLWLCVCVFFFSPSTAQQPHTHCVNIQSMHIRKTVTCLI